MIYFSFHGQCMVKHWEMKINYIKQPKTYEDFYYYNNFYYSLAACLYIAYACFASGLTDNSDLFFLIFVLPNTTRLVLSIQPSSFCRKEELVPQTVMEMEVTNPTLLVVIHAPAAVFVDAKYHDFSGLWPRIHHIKFARSIDLEDSTFSSKNTFSSNKCLVFGLVYLITSFFGN